MPYDVNRDTLVCLDLSVALHQIEENLARTNFDGLVSRLMASGKFKAVRAAEIATLEKLVKVNYDWFISLDWLGELKPAKYKVVLLKDWKHNIEISRATHVLPKDVENDSHSILGYWRHEYLKRLEVAKVLDEARDSKAAKRKPRANAKPKAASGVAYKDGRSHATNNFKIIKDRVSKLIQASGWDSLGVAGFEADDIMGGLVTRNRELGNPRQLLMVTTDTDWSGLVDFENVYWFCMFGWFPRFRATPEVLSEWSERRLKSPVKTGADIFDIKANKGDTSDNLPGGCPEIVRGVVDLLNPVAEFRVWDNPVCSKWLTKVLTEPVEVCGLDGTQSLKVIESIGSRPFIRKFDPSRDGLGLGDRVDLLEVPEDFIS